MISINLLPKINRDAIKSKRFNLYLTSMATIVLFLVGLMILGLFFLKITLNNRTKNLDKNLEEKKQTLSEYDEQKQLIENFNSSVALAGQLIEKEVSWLNILKDLEEATPSELRLSGFSFGSSQNGKAQTASKESMTSNKLAISGVASSQRMIVKFIKKLDQSKYFSDVKLVSSSGTSTTEEKETASSYTFELSAQLNEQG